MLHVEHGEVRARRLQDLADAGVANSKRNVPILAGAVPTSARSPLSVIVVSPLDPRC
jgi:hypothetical protein